MMKFNKKDILSTILAFFLGTLVIPFIFSIFIFYLPYITNENIFYFESVKVGYVITEKDIDFLTNFEKSLNILRFYGLIIGFSFSFFTVINIWYKKRNHNNSLTQNRKENS